MKRSQESVLHDALTRPHGADERLDPDFIITYRCERCGRLGMGPRKHLQEAVKEHMARCPVLRDSQSRDVVRLYFPRSN